MVKVRVRVVMVTGIYHKSKQMFTYFESQFWTVFIFVSFTVYAKKFLVCYIFTIFQTPYVCHLLYLLTRKEDVRLYRVRKLLELQTKLVIILIIDWVQFQCKWMKKTFIIFMFQSAWQTSLTTNVNNIFFFYYNY